ncbi:MAG: aminotransferase class I/II-fold pyridoxal phosphate-dependent enzyme [Allobranchiibius sp.]
MRTPAHLGFDLTQPEPIPQEGIERAVELMHSGRLFRYGETGSGDTDDAALLETRMAQLLGRRYAVGVNSCGASLFLALRSCGVLAGDPVLVNGWTLAPVPGAIDHAGAVPIVVEIDDELLIDLDDLRAKAQSSGSKVLVLSHMRGHIADVDAVVAICEELGLLLIEDCAHTLGASWAGQATGTFGVVGCFSLQTFKHLNAGEGGILVTDDPQIAARAILHSGSYMLYAQHSARPELAIFKPLRGLCANYSLRMTALAAALTLPQLDLLPARITAMNRSYRQLEAGCREIPGVRILERASQENYVGSSFQFALPDLTHEQLAAVVSVSGEFGLNLKWYGEQDMRGFTSRPEQWAYVPSARKVPRTDAVLSTVCDLRVPPGLLAEHCERILDILRYAVQVVTRPLEITNQHY